MESGPIQISINQVKSIQKLRIGEITIKGNKTGTFQQASNIMNYLDTNLHLLKKAAQRLAELKTSKENNNLLPLKTNHPKTYEQ